MGSNPIVTKNSFFLSFLKKWGIMQWVNLVFGNGPWVFIMSLSFSNSHISFRNIIWRPSFSVMVLGFSQWSLGFHNSDISSRNIARRLLGFSVIVLGLL